MRDEGGDESNPGGNKRGESLFFVGDAHGLSTCKERSSTLLIA